MPADKMTSASMRLLCDVQGVRKQFQKSPQRLSHSPVGANVSAAIRDFVGQDSCKQVAVSMVYLSETERLERRHVEDHTATYFHQTLGSDGSVVRQFQLTAWNYMSRIKSAKDVGVQLREFDEDLLTFTYGDAYYRCHIFHDNSAATGSDIAEATIIIETDAGNSLPSWLNVIQDVTNGHRYSSFPLA